MNEQKRQKKSVTATKGSRRPLWANNADSLGFLSVRSELLEHILVFIHQSSLCVNRCKNGETRSLFTLFSFVFVTSFHQQSPCYFQTQETRLIIYEYANLKGEEPLSHYLGFAFVPLFSPLASQLSFWFELSVLCF